MCKVFGASPKHLIPVLESSRTSPRLRGSPRTILKSLVLALALRVQSLASALALRLLSLTPSLTPMSFKLVSVGYRNTGDGDLSDQSRATVHRTVLMETAKSATNPGWWWWWWWLPGWQVIVMVVNFLGKYQVDIYADICSNFAFWDGWLSTCKIRVWRSQLENLGLPADKGDNFFSHFPYLMYKGASDRFSDQYIARVQTDICWDTDAFVTALCSFYFACVFAPFFLIGILFVFAFSGPLICRPALYDYMTNTNQLLYPVPAPSALGKQERG